MKYKDIIRKVSNDLNIPEEIVDKTYKCFWRTIRDKITELPLKEISEEEFDSLHTSFNIPSLGKLHCDKEKWKINKERFNNKKYVKN